ncbi:MAG: hypothetical protein CBB71_21655 [Rhodopirellula sp. TMED11]|nr:MAG: hypothetical protein CBB71_21655 [Rhodopirellula sp. TMED11]
MSAKHRERLQNRPIPGLSALFWRRFAGCIWISACAQCLQQTELTHLTKNRIRDRTKFGLQAS